jgi:hypothetical protein
MFLVGSIHPPQTLFFSTNTPINLSLRNQLTIT